MFIKFEIIMTFKDKKDSKVSYKMTFCFMKYVIKCIFLIKYMRLKLKKHDFCLFEFLIERQAEWARLDAGLRWCVLSLFYSQTLCYDGCTAVSHSTWQSKNLYKILKWKSPKLCTRIHILHCVVTFWTYFCLIQGPAKGPTENPWFLNYFLA